MSIHVYHDERTRDARRDYIRDNFPSGPKGYIFEDLDLIVRRFTKQDAQGKFALVEFKWGGIRMGYAQEMTFGFIHKLLRMGDRKGKNYLGFFVVNWPCKDMKSDIKEIDFSKNPSVNHKIVTWEKLREFLSLNKVPVSFWP